ncbi:MAG: DUF2344 domain-containing protein [Clostridiales bacterium]|nr:DUF2344 domain-containing protein [Clostridiales bacterium]
MRALYCFAKKDRLRFVSHLDLQRFMQRALNRTSLNIAYSNGFNPHPILSFASALAMGWTSDYELFDVKFASPVTEEVALAEMQAALPPDLPILSVRLVEDNHPALMGKLVMADYEIRLSGESSEEVCAAIDTFLAQESVIALRKTKSGEKPTDIRPMARILEKRPYGIFARLMLTEKETLKPDLLVNTLASMANVSAPEMRVHRLMLLGEDAGGNAIPLQEV